MDIAALVTLDDLDAQLRPLLQKLVTKLKIWQCVMDDSRYMKILVLWAFWENGYINIFAPTFKHTKDGCSNCSQLTKNETV